MHVYGRTHFGGVRYATQKVDGGYSSGDYAMRDMAVTKPVARSGALGEASRIITRHDYETYQTELTLKRRTSVNNNKLYTQYYGCPSLPLRGIPVTIQE